MGHLQKNFSKRNAAVASVVCGDVCRRITCQVGEALVFEKTTYFNRGMLPTFPISLFSFLLLLPLLSWLLLLSTLLFVFLFDTICPSPRDIHSTGNVIAQTWMVGKLVVSIDIGLVEI